MKCQPFGSDMKIRLLMPDGVRFYYPDVSIVCTPISPDDVFTDSPKVVIEVTSESTRRIDIGEKRDAYLTIPSLSTYIIFEQDKRAAIFFRRTDSGFSREAVVDSSASVPLPEIECELSLSDVYERVEFDVDRSE
jgi:Uma2 family endonuclease